MKKLLFLILVILFLLPDQSLFSQWSEISEFTGKNVIALAIRSTDTLFVGTNNDGMYSSPDHGSSWTLDIGYMVDVYKVYSVAFDSAGNFYAGTYEKGLFRSTDNGHSWSNYSLSLPMGVVRAIATTPTGTIFATDDGNVYRSTDHGGTWAVVKYSSGGSTGGFQTIAFDNSRVYISGSNDWLYYSTDNGDHWTPYSSGLTSAPLSLAVNSIGIVFAGTSIGVFKSTNYGVSWTKVNNGLTTTNINTIAINAANVLYVGTYGGGVFLSVDNGSNWTASNGGLTNLDIRSLAFDNLGNLYAGAYKSSGGGGLWQSAIPLPVELTAFNACQKENSIVLQWNTATEMNNYGFEVERRAVKNDGSAAANWEKIGFVSGYGTRNSPYKYSYTDENPPPGRSVYRLKQLDNTGEFTYSQSIELDFGIVPATVELSQNYPNPFNPSTTFMFSIPEDGTVTLKIFNIAGCEVKELVHGILRAGNHRIVWSPETIAAGIYVYRLHYGDKILSKKLIYLK
jgi:photosystem II stability/assembly factor-like uncharacterized protein